MKIKLSLSVLSCIVATTMLSGCVSTEMVSTPSGKVGHAIDCSAIGMTSCYKKAGEVCGNRGYDVVNKTEVSSFDGWSDEKSLIIQCK